ncbi:biotin transporter BioY [Deinococcus psychrotolerans]|uniref:Biotin transporter n=1 Tax=Deinococcus psychrotolerans TaxID=2489213 RepID=A0A3G8YDT2_9DEIO|nr:biotin transporter BioY [Deinococcus psychrotolerans]AZI43083.1 biotin transporter BioY [Deinococcus psychrotolerans]
MTQPTYPTLSSIAVSQPGLIRSAALVLGGAALVAVCAQISIPMYPVPLTLQTLAVLLVGAVLGSRKGAAAMLTYLAAGAAGLPIFAGGGASLLSAKTGQLTPTLGYLLGFVLAAGLVGLLVERFAADRTPLGTALAMLVGNAVIYIPGLLLLGTLTGLKGQGLLAAGLTPFLLGDAIKLALGAALLPGAWALLRRR